MKSETHYQLVLDLAASAGLIRSQDLDKIGVPRVVLAREACSRNWIAGSILSLIAQFQNMPVWQRYLVSTLKPSYACFLR